MAHGGARRAFFFFFCVSLLLLLRLLRLPVTEAATSCGAGLFLFAGNGSCLTCAGNSYCGGGCSGACIACPANTTADTNHTTCLSGTCNVCPVGNVCPGGYIISACPPGTFNGTWYPLAR